jgi:hypothetical protein
MQFQISQISLSLFCNIRAAFADPKLVRRIEFNLNIVLNILKISGVLNSEKCEIAFLTLIDHNVAITSYAYIVVII